MAASALVLIIPSDRPSRVAGLGGTYRAQTQRGPHGQPIYYNSRKGLFLFATSATDLAISTRVGTAVHRARRGLPGSPPLPDTPRLRARTPTRAAGG